MAETKCLKTLAWLKKVGKEGGRNKQKKAMLPGRDRVEMLKPSEVE